jgi:hypothetical protein
MATQSKSASPYDDIAPEQRWSSFAAAFSNGVFEAQGGVRFAIDPTESIASAGSCFATRLAEELRETTTQYLAAEPAPHWLAPESAAKYGYVPFSARFGLVYSTLQLEQLFERAYGRFEPQTISWKRDDRFVDPFRPTIAPNGYGSEAELVADRAQHFTAVRRMFESANVFVFTLGMTEIWKDRIDGAVFPLCPGLSGGTYDASRHEFANLSVAQNVDSLERFIERLRRVNPTIRLILTVSPVPLGATIERQHVARATTYSKSILRVVAEEMYRNHAFVDYFAAYELVSQSFFGRDPFATSRRHLKPGVARGVVAAFRSCYLPHAATRGAEAGQSIVDRTVTTCDEDILAR